MMIISLIGYMGSGKSFIANRLNEERKMKKIDLDFEISKEIGMSISEIFQKEGQIFFRKIEKEILERIFLEEKECVLSVGGGTPCYYNNMDLINEKSISVYLRAKVDTLVKRLLKEKTQRPLITKIPDEQLPEFIGQHLFERNEFYNQAQVIIDTDNLTAEEVVYEINKGISRVMQKNS